MTAQDVLAYTRAWAWDHGFRAIDVYPIMRAWQSELPQRDVVLFYVRDVGMRQP